MTGSPSKRSGAGCEGVACEHTLGQQPLELYSYLWRKLDDGLSANSNVDRFSFVLADTVIFKHQKPVMWLFTSHQEKGMILRKSKKNLSAAVVLQEFKTPKAMAHSQSQPHEENEDQVVATYAYLERSLVSPEPRMFIEHLNRAGLEELLHDREKPPLSVLQRYIPTRSGYNHTYQSVYTTEECVVSKVVNPHSALDTTVSLAERTVTFEVNDQQSRQREVTDKEVKIVIDKINSELSSHLERLVGKQCVRLVSYFKLGANRRIYLLWSSVIAFESVGKPVAKQYTLALPNQHKQSKGDTSSHETRLLASQPQHKACPNCKRILPRTQVDYLVSFKTIINQAAAAANDVQVDNDQGGQIPAPILEAHGPLNIDRYNELKQLSSFLYRTATVCQACAASINGRLNELPLVKSPPKPSPPPENNREKAEPRRDSAHDLFWGKVEREHGKNRRPSGSAPPRAVSAGRTRILFTKANMKNGGTSYRRFAANVLPQLSTPAQPKPVEAPKDSRSPVQNLAVYLKRQFGRPSLRFALAQRDIFLTNGSVVLVATLGVVCDEGLLSPAIDYWRSLCNPRWIAPFGSASVDVDELDGILSGSILSRPTQPPARSGVRLDSNSSDCPHQPPTIIACARPQRPKSAAPTIPSAIRPARRVSVAGSVGQQQTSSIAPSRPNPSHELVQPSTMYPQSAAATELSDQRLHSVIGDSVGVSQSPQPPEQSAAQDVSPDLKAPVPHIDNVELLADD